MIVARNPLKSFPGVNPAILVHIPYVIYRLLSQGGQRCLALIDPTDRMVFGGHVRQFEWYSGRPCFTDGHGGLTFRFPPLVQRAFVPQYLAFQWVYRNGEERREWDTTPLGVPILD